VRALLSAGALSLAFTLFLTPLFIRLFVRLGWGQFIRDDGPQSHHVKRGTPTMGGIVFILGTVVSYFAATLLISNETPTATGLLVLFMMVGLGLVGFLDDFLKTRKKQSLGLGGWAKVAGQTAVAAGFALLAINFPNDEGVTPAPSTTTRRPAQSECQLVRASRRPLAASDRLIAAATRSRRCRRRRRRTCP